ncbi:hypothetical protein [Flavobacterium cellulosilyticum]|uniref:Uncharacterized protein n=1 Tax=Flavobacterium cellulosilyticum TaxID=2541731 RepID=A0A4R5CM83_9FLAO|nr:hypothetical protein [Flavobacterium cellulosilyticum]TDD98612.1 hypothetical protein E0F76_05665 [Flavobacterium cellulosilyticum]
MKKLNLDYFKISILLILLGFLLVFYQYSQNGRYISKGEDWMVIDTHTGKIYHCNPSPLE